MALERKGLKMNVVKTEVVCMREGREDLEIMHRKNIKLKQVKRFKYRESVLSVKGEYQEDVKARIKAA